jgi:AraC-like DNA-binding protein
MAIWTFSLDEIPEAERQSAWIDMLRRLKLPAADPAALAWMEGSVAIAKTALGSEFAVLSSSAQTFGGRNPDHNSAIWLAALIEGEAQLESGGVVTAMRPGAILVGASGIESTLRITTDFRMLFLKLPQVAIGPRLIMPLGQRVGLLGATSKLQQIFYGLLAEIAETLEYLSNDDFQPIEQSIIEFLVACLASDGRVESRGGAAGARASHLNRLCMRIETLLHDPELSVVKVAADNGVSSRYLQKLFTSADTTFSSYLKSRRLERCYADLISPIHAQLAISEICFRWGFSDAAHFSRAFRNRFGISPSQHRLSATRRA